MLLTIDIGTSNFKSAVWDYGGNLLSHIEIPLSSIKSDGDKHEADSAEWLRAFENCCRKLEYLSSVEAIVISGNGPTLVPVTGEPSNGSGGLSVPAENARLWLDRRAVKYQEEVSSLMGGFVDAGFFLPKILSIKYEENDLYNKVKHFLGCSEYLAFALTGEARTVFPSDGYDRWFWNDNVLKKLDIAASKLPSFIRPGEQFGIINPQLADKFNIKKNVPVVCGGPDFFAAILGSGVSKPGQACDRTGSSEGINLCTNRHVNDKRLMSYGHPVPPFWNLSGIINTTGKAIEWCSTLLGLSGLNDFYALAKESKPGSGGLIFLPYLTGERAPIWDSSIRGLWRGISLSSARAEFANSVLEGIGFAIKDVINVMEETGEKTEQLRVTGSMAASVHLNQVKADITGIEILEGEHKEGELLGLAIIGACFLGKYSSYKEASSAMVKTKNRYVPHLKNKDIYEQLFENYKSAGRSLK